MAVAEIFKIAVKTSIVVLPFCAVGSACSTRSSPESASAPRPHQAESATQAALAPTSRPPSPPTASLERLPPFTGCPAGTLQIGGQPPVATERLCVTPPNEREGRYTRWYENGLFAEEVDYIRGRQEGRSVSLTDDGLPREAGTFVNGRKSGLWTSWQYGQLAYTGEFLNDLQHGPFAAFDRETATLSAVGQFRYGEPCGAFQCFSAGGAPTACAALEGKCPTTPTGGECPACETIPPRAAVVESAPPPPQR